MSTPDGATVRVGDLATITDGFEDTDEEAYFNGQRAVQVKVFRVGKETPQSVSDDVHAYLEELRPELPDGIGVSVWEDWAIIYRDRMSLLLKNAFQGLILVLLFLGLFLDLKLAFWVTVGLPTAIIGSFLFIPFTGASINMISLFAFIITLGIIVDDAVVAGKSSIRSGSRGCPWSRRRLRGPGDRHARHLCHPDQHRGVPALFFVPGELGIIIRQVPSIVVRCSWCR